MTDILSLKVEELVSKIKDSQLTSVEICKKYIERVNEFEKDVCKFKAINIAKKYGLTPKNSTSGKNIGTKIISISVHSLSLIHI